MASDPDLDASPQWSHHITTDKDAPPSTSSTRYPYSPSIASTASSSYDSEFSIDAPSSQSSDTSADAWSSSDRASWLEVAYGLDDHSTQQAGEVIVPTYGPYTNQNQQNPRVVAPEFRQHPRRTQRFDSYESQDGQTTAAYPRPPPSLVRQSERKDNFVDSLLDTASQMIEVIWPLSVVSCSRDATLYGKQQNMLGLRTFVHEVLRRSKTSYSTLQVALYYLVLIQSCIPKHDFTMEQSEDSLACRAMQCGRRMFLAALILASKYLQDRNYSSRAWSKISGLTSCEINANELAFLSAVQYKLHLPEPMFHRWTDLVLKYSPSAQVKASSRSRSAPSHTWKAIVPLLTPELDTVPLEIGEISDDSGYNSPGSDLYDMSPPPVPIREAQSPRLTSNESTPTQSCGLAGTLEPGKTLPTLPHLRPLPTPQLTPQTDTFCTPAVSASGLGCGSAMSQAMAQVRKSSLSRSTLDHPYRWKPHAPTAFPPPSRRSSLARSVSSMSSPESMISDATTRSSRSSSISSVASSNCALPPPKLAVQATRRCANMKSYGWKGKNMRSQSTDEEAFPEHVAQATDVKDLYPPPQYHDAMSFIPYFDAQHNEDTGEAATALHELHLDRQLPTPKPQAIPRPQKGRKRARPNSVDLSVQSCVRDEIAPRCLGDIHDMNTRRAKESKVLPDRRVAYPSIVERCGNSRLSSSSNIKPALSGECLPNKRSCAGSDRGKRGEARLIMQNLMTRRPGMWDGILDD